MQLEQKPKDENTGKVQFPVGHDGLVSSIDVSLKIALAIAPFQSLEKYGPSLFLSSRTNHSLAFR